MIKLYRENDQYVEVEGLRNLADGIFVNDATLTATLIDKDSVDVPGLIAVPGEYQAASDGTYRFPAWIPASPTPPPNGRRYRLVVEGDVAGKAFSVTIPTEVATRRSGTET